MNRRTLGSGEIGVLSDYVHARSPGTYVVVDNCYGEFTETAEPRADITQKITTRVNSYTQLTISKLQAQIADISRQTAITRAEAETKARTLTASETKDKSLQLMELELQEQAVDAWNGQLPRIQPKDNQTIIVGSDALQGTVGGKR